MTFGFPYSIHGWLSKFFLCLYDFLQIWHWKLRASECWRSCITRRLWEVYFLSQTLQLHKSDDPEWWSRLWVTKPFKEANDLLQTWQKNLWIIAMCSSRTWDSLHRKLQYWQLIDPTTLCCVSMWRCRLPWLWNIRSHILHFSLSLERLNKLLVFETPAK